MYGEKIAIVVPMLNEAPSVRLLLQQLDELVPTLNCSVSTIAVDDGSTDSTVSELAAMRPRYFDLRTVSLSRNFGKEAAILAGLDLVDHDAVIIMDGDGEHPSNCLPEMLAAWREGFEVIRMRRIDRSADPWWRRILVRWFYRIIQLSSDVPQIAEVSDFCLLDRVVVDVIRRLPERNRMFKGLISWCGFSSRVLDYTPNRRRDGHSRFGLRGLFRLGILGITSFSTWPLRVWTLVGMGVAFLAALYTLQIVVQVFQYGRDVPGYASLMVSVLFLGGVQLICLGVLGEYIGKIYTEVKQRPQYVIKSDSAESERIDPKA